MTKAPAVRFVQPKGAKPLPRTLPPVHPNAGVEAQYRKKLRALIDEMNVSVQHWLGAAYKANPPQIAQDEIPAAVLQRVIRRLAKRWQKRFDGIAPKLAEYFAQSANLRSASVLRSILKEGGISVEFKMTRVMQDAMKASINEQVSLIRSIPQQYFTQIEGAIMRSVAAGRDLAPLSKFLQDQYGVTRRRAAFIAIDQNNKATATMTRVRQIELGITEAVWVHSGGGKEPRPTHVAAGARKQRYDVREGWLDPHEGKKIFPGELARCRCVSRSVVPGFS